MNVEDLIFSVVITLVLYFIPVVIYRYAIRRHGMNKKKAKKFCIIYGIISFAIMMILKSILMGSIVMNTTAAFTWGYINYHMLHDKGEDVTDDEDIPDDNVETIYPVVNPDTEKQPPVYKQNNNTGAPVVIQASSEPSKPSQHVVNNVSTFKKVLYCRKCGAKLIEGSDFCRKCGTKIKY